MEEVTANNQGAKEDEANPPTLTSPAPLILLCSMPLGPRPRGSPNLWERAPPGPAAPPLPSLPLPRAFIRMLFPEKLDVDKKGRPSTAGSKIKVGPGRARRSWAWGGLRPLVCPSQCRSLPGPKPSPPASGTLCPARSSSSAGVRGLGPASSINP